MAQRRDSIPNRGDAQSYNRFASQGLGPWDRLLISRAVTECPTPPIGSLIVDVGTGSATVPIALAGHPVFSVSRIVGIELFADMAKIARERVAEAGLADQIEILEDDAQALSLADEIATMVVSRATLHHLAAPDRALAEMWRVTGPGGVVIVHDLRRDAPPALIAQLNATRAKLGYPPTIIEEKFALEDVHNMVERAGLRDHAVIHAGESGAAALGFEILIHKPR
jgi:ubiquinone/menaquinone biosynthesis C-methylase UbiE